MNPNSMMHPSPQWLAAMAARGYASAGKKTNRVTIGGICLFFVGMAIFLSGLGVFRPPVGHLRLQPYLLPLGLGSLLILPRLAKFPTKVLAAFFIFWSLYAVSMLGTSVQKVTPLEEALKLASAFAVVVIVASLVSTRGDFVLGSLGLSVAIGLLAFRGMAEEQENYIDVANKNSYSMYALPALLLASYIALRVDWNKVSFRRVALIGMGLSSAGAAIAIVVGANRSGYLGLVLVALMTGFYAVFSPRLGLVRRARRSLRLAYLIVAVGVVVVGALHKGTQVFEHRLEQTEEGNSSDQLRVDLVKTSLMIGLEHPVLGVSPQVLPIRLAQRLYPDLASGEGIQTHNVFAHIIGGCGFIAMAVLLYAAWALFFWRPRYRGGPESADFYDARSLLRMMLILWGVRGMFSQEILFNPGFCMGLGLAIGLCMVELDLLKTSAAARFPAMNPMIPQHPNLARS